MATSNPVARQGQHLRNGDVNLGDSAQENARGILEEIEEIDKAAVPCS